MPDKPTPTYTQTPIGAPIPTKYSDWAVRTIVMAGCTAFLIDVQGQPHIPLESSYTPNWLNAPPVITTTSGVTHTFYSRTESR